MRAHVASARERVTAWRLPVNACAATFRGCVLARRRSVGACAETFLGCVLARRRSVDACLRGARSCSTSWRKMRTRCSNSRAHAMEESSPLARGFLSTRSSRRTSPASSRRTSQPPGGTKARRLSRSHMADKRRRDPSRSAAASAQSFGAGGSSQTIRKAISFRWATSAARSDGAKGCLRPKSSLSSRTGRRWAAPLRSSRVGTSG